MMSMAGISMPTLLFLFQPLVTLISAGFSQHIRGGNREVSGNRISAGRGLIDRARECRELPSWAWLSACSSGKVTLSAGRRSETNSC